MYVEIGILPGYHQERRRRRKKRRCRYPKGTKGKIRWRHALRKFRRIRKRQRKLARNPKSKKSKSSMSSESKAKRERRKKMRKRKKLRKKKDSRRRHRVKRHLYGTKERKLRAKSRKKMTKEQIISRLAELKMKRVQILQKYYRNRALVCSPKRKAIRRLKKCWRRARHQRKKYIRYRRHLEEMAAKKNMKNWRYAHRPPKDRTQRPRCAEAPKKEPVKPSKRVEYIDRYPMRVLVNLLEMKNEEVHCKEKGKIVMDNLIVRVQNDVVGDFGREPTKIHYVGHDDWALADLRWQTQIIHDKTGSREGRVLAKLAQLGSPNAVRVLYYGQFQNLQCLVTSQLRKATIGDQLKDQKWDMPSLVHLIQQTFYCVRDLHRVGYCHLAISPDNFSFLMRNQGIVVFNNFQFARTRESIRERKRAASDEYPRMIRTPRQLPKLHLMPYMSRRQHFRMVRGTADDYESWFYVCARIMNNEMVKEWEKEKTLKTWDHAKMAQAKYDFVKKYKHPDKLADKKMKQILAYCLSANEINTQKVAFFIERVIQHWVDKLAKGRKKNADWPWVNKAHKETKRAYGVQEKFLKGSKKWFKPKKGRVCKY